MISILLIILLFLMICKIRDDLQEEIKKYLTKEEWEKWLIDHLDVGLKIEKSREDPKIPKSGHGLRPKTKRPRPKPRPKDIRNYKIGLTDPD